MKVNGIQTYSAAFSGYKPVKSNAGYREYEFNFPFDEDAYDCYLEVYSVEKDEDGGYKIKYFEGEDGPQYKVKLNSGKNIVNDYMVSSGQSFAYRYEIRRKGSEETFFYDMDPGTKVSNGCGYNDFNLVLAKGSGVNTGGSMKLLLPDSYNNNWVYNQENQIVKNENKPAPNVLKNLATKSGGSLAGVEKDIEAGKFDGYTRIVSTPIFTDDSLSHHAYWNKNPMQMAHGFGNINNYTSLQKKMFARGINWVSDGAFVNEGLEGIHLRNIMRWGEKSPYLYWFRISGFPLKPGIFGKDHTFTRSRVVQFETPADKAANKNKPLEDHKATGKTYIQIYDERLVSKEWLKRHPHDLIESYDKNLDLDNCMNIVDHNDTVVPYSFEIDPEHLEHSKENHFGKKAKKVSAYINEDYNYRDTLAIFKTDTYIGEEKNASGGIDTWDANPDIAKLNYSTSHFDTKRLITAGSGAAELNRELVRSSYEAQDLAITSGQYWTKKTNRILTLHSAQNLKGITKENALRTIYNRIYDKNSNPGGAFPEKLRPLISQKFVDNIFKGKYNFKELSDESYSDQILAGLMDIPPDSIETGDEISGVLGSPYLNKCAVSENELGRSRYEIYKEDPESQARPEKYRKTYNIMNDDIYNGEMSALAQEVLAQTEVINGQKFHDGQEVTTLGKYVLPHLTAQIAKFAVIKALRPDAKLNVDPVTGDIAYDYKELKKTTLNDLKIDYAETPEIEAALLAGKLKKGIRHITPEAKKELAKALAKSIEGTNEHSFKFAEAIVDLTGAGLDWRIDAVKDIADMEAIRNGLNWQNDIFPQINKFWTNFSQNVLKENPNAYFAAEITDVVLPRFLQDTGITTTADYSHSFGISRIFGKNFEDGNDINFSIGGELKSILSDTKIPLESVLYSYTFAGNHDKPRILHCLALDMDLFYSDLSELDDKRKIEIYRLFEDKFYDSSINEEDIENFPFNLYSSKAAAMGLTLWRGFGLALDRLKKEEMFLADTGHKDYVFGTILKSISDLTCGRYMGKNFQADGFGAAPIDMTIEVVLNQAEKQHNLKLTPEQHKKIADVTFETILTPAAAALKGMQELLVVFPGNPTLFAGDDLGSTGYEQKSRNIHVQNRNALHHEWSDIENKAAYKNFIEKLEKDMQNIMALRSKPEYRALNDGTPFLLASPHSGVDAVLRQSPDGAMAICLFNTLSIIKEVGKSPSPQLVKFSKIDLSNLRAGLKTGMNFVDTQNPELQYKVSKDSRGYFLVCVDKNGFVRRIKLDNFTKILYHLPDDTKSSANPAFTARRTLYNPQYSFASNPYQGKAPALVGSKLKI